MLETPVLFMIFNRPDTTQQVFNAIKKQQPTKLFVGADGHRRDKDEAELCEYTREIIKQIDWDCELHTLYRTENLGSKDAVRGAIDWMFTFVEEGIILEDDCLPDDSFFSFCQLMLNTYRNETKIKIISGSNYFYEQFNHINSYCFLPYTFIWGWATWKNRWEEVSFDDKTFNPDQYKNKLKEICYNSKLMENHLFAEVNTTIKGQQNAWDSYLLLSSVLSDGLSIVPNRNLISNIGEQSSRTNEIVKKQAQKYSSFRKPLVSMDSATIIHPNEISLDYKKNKSTIIGISKCLVGELYFLPPFIRRRIYKLIKFKDIYWVGRQCRRLLLPYFPFLKAKEIQTGKLQRYAKHTGVNTEKNKSDCLAIIVPCFKHAIFLKKCLDSIKNQTVLPNKLIIVNDASPDHTPKVILDFITSNPQVDVLQIQNPTNIGQAACINKAIEAHYADLYMIVNDDDCLLPRAVEHQLDVFRKNEDIHLFGASGFIVTDNAEIDKQLQVSHLIEPNVQFRYPEACWSYKENNDLNMMHTSSAFTRIAWGHVGGYYTDKTKRLVPFSDRDFQLRVNACFVVGVDDKLPLGFWRSNSSVDRGLNS
ncbi:MAG: glycosyltransferase family A protein [Bacteroidota bacterium]